MISIVYGTSIRGSAHYKTGAVCQDKNSYEPSDNEKSDPVKVIAIADGHGGAKYIRSDIGASASVKVAKEEIRKLFLESMPLFDELDKEDEDFEKYFIGNFIADLKSEAAILNSNKTAILEELNKRIESTKRKIIERWRDEVISHFKENPLTYVHARMCKANFESGGDSLGEICGYADSVPKAVSFLNRGLDTEAATKIAKVPTILYGSTLLAAGQYKNHVIFFKLGDGDISVTDSNDKSSLILGDINEIETNVTDSICHPNALDYFKSEYIKADYKIIMLTTDGVGKKIEKESLIEESKVIYDAITESPAEFMSEIKEYLRYYSSIEVTDGDDCTLAFIANQISDEIYDSFICAEETPENDEELKKLYNPFFLDYQISDGIYLPVVMKDGIVERLVVSASDEYKSKNNEFNTYVIMLRKMKMKLPHNAVIKEKLIEALKEDKEMEKEYLSSAIDENKLLLLERTTYRLAYDGDEIKTQVENDFGIVELILNNTINIKPLKKECYYELKKGKIEINYRRKNQDGITN